MRWKLLRRYSRVRGRARAQLGQQLRTKLITARAWALKDLLEHFWTFKSVRHAGQFLNFWIWRALRSRIGLVEKVARTLRTHEELILNWFRAKGRFLVAPSASACVDAAQRQDVLIAGLAPEHARLFAARADHGLAPASMTPAPINKPCGRKIRYCIRSML